ncbi:MAG: hypothetical protein FJZ59_04950 [Chlamydiae bacterium]|nr:hypothetical protein [Chlamydiota bacterium]
MFGSPLIIYSSDYSAALEKAKSVAANEASLFDIFSLEVEGKNYTKEQIVEFLQDITLPPYEGNYKVYLFHHADKMLAVHANALLKTFEEKPDYAIILLVTDNIKGIIETILSRCQKMYVPSFLENKKEVVEEKVLKALLSISKNDLYTCLDTIKEIEDFNVEDVADIIFSWYRDLTVLKLGLSEVTYPEAKEAFALLKQIPTLESINNLINRAKIALERHTKPKLILEYLFLSPWCQARHCGI